MDDDFTFGASVWGTAAQPVDLLDKPEGASSSTASNSFDDEFDDFGPSEEADGAADDDFGDFGDFGEADDQAPTMDFEGGFADEHTIPAPVAGSSVSNDWSPLRLDPLPTHEELLEQLDSLLGSLWEGQDLSEYTTNEDIRDVDGISQILAVRESRDLYNALMQLPPPSKPPNWIRSRIRRQHLIALGIPVNLDEVLPPSVNGKRPLPPLQISTRPMSAPPGPRKLPQQNGHQNGSASNSRAATPTQAGRSNNFLGPRPEIDQSRINKILATDPDNLPLLPIPALEKHLAELRELTTNASGLLTYLLQLRDTLQQDSDTYNGLIAELVGEAQKIKTGKGRTPLRKGTT